MTCTSWISRGRALGYPTILSYWVSTSESEIEGMAGNLPVPNGIALKLVWNLSGVPAALNILNFNNLSGGVVDQAAANAVDGLVKTAFASSGLAASIWSSVALARIELRDLDALSNPWYIGSGAATPGTSAANPLPAATALVVSLATGLRGRSYNGRYYQWGYTEDANDAAGGATAAAAANTVAFVSAINTAMQGAPRAWNICVLSRWTRPLIGPPSVERQPPIVTPVTSIHTKDLRWDVQRRRAVPGI